jgi:HK97 family phage prohead protease
VKYPGALWPVFWMHDYKDPESVVGVVAAAQTSEGLVIEGQLDLDSERAMHVYEGLLGNRIREWSIAYAINRAREDTWEGEHVRYLDELELLEISAVYSGANRFTRTVEVRSRSTTSSSDATASPDGDSYEPDELALINARLDQLASNERPRSPELARRVDDLIVATRLELVQEALDRAEQAAWEERQLNMVRDPVPIRVDARARPDR